jgi:hypothetical protein
MWGSHGDGEVGEIKGHRSVEIKVETARKRKRFQQGKGGFAIHKTSHFLKSDKFIKLLPHG